MSVSTRYDYEKIAGELFTGDLRKRLEAVDRKRQNKGIFGTLMIISAASVLLYYGSTEAGFYSGITGIIIGILLLSNVFANRRRFYRTEVLPQLVKSLEPELKFVPDRGLSQSKFRQLNLFDSFDRYRSEDHITGLLGKTRIEAAEVHIEKKYRSNDNKTTYSTIFCGVVFIADFNKHFRGRTVVLPDMAEKYFGKLLGNFLQQMNFCNFGKLVKLENVEFEKRFAVYSTDQQEARYLLTPQFMERLLDIQTVEKSPIRVSFMDSNIVIAFPRRRGWLEPPCWGKLARIKVLTDSLKELAAVIQLVEVLDLNTRIWTKE